MPFRHFGLCRQKSFFLTSIALNLAPPCEHCQGATSPAGYALLIRTPDGMGVYPNLLRPAPNARIGSHAM
jgi:hypothetical protein